MTQLEFILILIVCLFGFTQLVNAVTTQPAPMTRLIVASGPADEARLQARLDAMKRRVRTVRVVSVWGDVARRENGFTTTHRVSILLERTAA